MGGTREGEQEGGVAGTRRGVGLGRRSGEEGGWTLMALQCRSISVFLLLRNRWLLLCLGMGVRD